MITEDFYLVCGEISIWLPERRQEEGRPPDTANWLLQGSQLKTLGGKIWTVSVE